MGWAQLGGLLGLSDPGPALWHLLRGPFPNPFLASFQKSSRQSFCHHAEAGPAAEGWRGRRRWGWCSRARRS